MIRDRSLFMTRGGLESNDFLCKFFSRPTQHVEMPNVLTLGPVCTLDPTALPSGYSLLTPPPPAINNYQSLRGPESS